MICNRVRHCVESAMTDTLSKCSTNQNCIAFSDTRKTAVCTEKRKRYAIENYSKPSLRRRVTLLHIDGGVVVVDRTTPENQGKCDYLFVVETAEYPVAVLVELKGVHIREAVNQIKETLKLLDGSLNSCRKVHARIICGSGTPNIKTTPAYINLSREIKRRNGTIEIYANNYVESIASL